MGKLMILCGILLMTTGCSHQAQDSWSGQDKAQHFIGSAMLAAAGAEYGHHQGWSKDRSNAFGLMFSVSIGAGKEAWDSRPAGTGWSWKDFAWDMAGAATGYTVWQLASD